MIQALLALGLGVLAATGQELEVPANDGWVTDKAGLLQPAEEQALESLMESYRVGSGNEVALLTVPNLSGRPIEEFALRVARAWKIGDKETNTGALLVVAREEHALRIEVGRGLEGKLTDSISGRIIRDVIVPEFRAGRFYPGIRGGIEAIHAALGGDYGALERHSDAPPAAVPLVGLLVIVLILVLARRGLRMSRRGGSSMLPWILASQIGSSRGWSGGRSGSSGSSGGGGFSGFGGGSSGGGGFSGFGGGGGFSGGGASGRW